MNIIGVGVAVTRSGVAACGPTGVCGVFLITLRSELILTNLS